MSSYGRSTPRVTPPELDGWRVVAHERIPIRRLSLYVLALIPVWIIFFVLLLLVSGYEEVEVTVTLGDVVIAFLLVLVGIPVLHEALHGLAARLVGARPSYGISWGFAYTTFREPVSPQAYRFIGLAPLIGITALGFVLLLAGIYPGFTILFVLVNAMGAVGDLWIVWEMRQVPGQAQIYDLADGYAVFLPEGETPIPSL